MKHAQDAAYGGVLTALTVVLLLMTSAFPPLAWCFCIGAGLATAIPLMCHMVRMGILVYLASSGLAVLVVPGKRYAAAYILLFGVYPMLKYGLECKCGRVLVWCGKLLYAGALGLILRRLVQTGLVSMRQTILPLPDGLFVVGCVLVFLCCDAALSHMLALLERFLHRL